MPPPSDHGVSAPKRAGSRTTAEWDALLAKNLAATTVHGPQRVVVDPARRAYAAELAQVLVTKLDQRDLGWFIPTHAELEACERRFLETARAELEAGHISVLPKWRAFALEPIFATFTAYERQAVGWTAKGVRYVYLRYRLPSADQPPLGDEYHVDDGGHAYFEMQCTLPGADLFAVEVNGES